MISVLSKKVFIIGLILLASIPQTSKAAPNDLSPKPKVSKPSKKITSNWLSLKFTWDGALKSWEPPPGITLEVMSENRRVWFEYKCRNLNKYLDFGPNTRVVITDEKSIVLDADNMFWDYEFKEGEWFNYWDGVNLDKEKCYLEQNFKLPKRNFYGIKIGNENIYTISYQELRNKKFSLVLSKG